MHINHHTYVLIADLLLWHQENVAFNKRAEQTSNYDSKWPRPCSAVNADRGGIFFPTIDPRANCIATGPIPKGLYSTYWTVDLKYQYTFQEMTIVAARCGDSSRHAEQGSKESEKITMGMRMMVTVFLLVVLATTVVSFTLDRASDGRNAAADDKASDLISQIVKNGCCSNPACSHTQGC